MSKGDRTVLKVLSGVALVVAVAALAVGIFVLVSGDSDEDARTLDSTPTKADPAAYTQAFVDEAVRRYKEDGRDATIAYYNSPESIDGLWYMFIADENNIMLAHAAIPENVGMSAENINGPDGYPAGRMVVAGVREGGAWIPYTYLNPATGAVESKYSWVLRHDGLIFGSGWYEEGPSKSDPAAYTVAYVDKALDLYYSLGLEETVAYYNRPESVDGEWYMFIADENDVMIAHGGIPENVGRNLADIDGPDGYPAGKAVLAGATSQGAWVDYVFLNPATGGREYKHSWVITVDGLLFGSGWYEEGPSKADREAYTVAFVEKAIDLYDRLGLEEAIAYYNRPESADGQWYVFIIDPDGYTIGHPREEIRGRDPSERVDITGYFYGDDLLSVPEEGAWVDYVFLNIAAGTEQVKHTWAVERDGYIFGSGWYERYIGTLPGQG